MKVRKKRKGKKEEEPIRKVKKKGKCKTRN